MPTPVTTYRVLVASPSDVEEERAAMRAAMHEWNERNAEDYAITFLPSMWEFLRPESGKRPQDIINERLGKSDMLIGVFWARIGTQTGEDISGTVEEIRRFREAGKDVMLYFSKRPGDFNKVDTEQLIAVRGFRDQFQRHSLTGEFNSPDDLRQQLSDHLTQVARTLSARTPPSPDMPAGRMTLHPPSAPPRGGEDESGALKEAWNYIRSALAQALALAPGLVWAPDPDHLHRMNADEFKTFVTARYTLAPELRDRVLAASVKERAKVLGDAQTWQRISDAQQAIAELDRHLWFKGVFLPDGLREQFRQANTLLQQAVSGYELGHHLMTDYGDDPGMRAEGGRTKQQATQKELTQAKAVIDGLEPLVSRQLGGTTSFQDEQQSGTNDNPPFLSIPLGGMIRPDEIDAQRTAAEQGQYPGWKVERISNSYIDSRQQYDLELKHVSGQLESRSFRWDMTDPYGGLFVWRRIR